MKIVPIDELDALLNHFDEGYTISHDEAYRRFVQSEAAPPTDLPADPFSPEYARRYLDLYLKISERSRYEVSNERSEFDIDERVLRPFPYYTHSLPLASLHFSLMGKLMAMMELKDGARILECGFGWGNTTLALAMLGFDVTALDIEERYCEVVRRRAADAKVNVNLVNSDFLWIETTDQKFDAIIFFESFHHCWEFERLLKAIHRVLLPGGKIYFGAEPINRHFKVPWGVRLDGESLFVARRFGWMELGFHDDFFAELLTRTGWFGRCIEPHFWVATRRGDPITHLGSDPLIGTQGGTKNGSSLSIDVPQNGPAKTYAAFGPYITLPRGNYEAYLDLTIDAAPGEVTLDICYNRGETQIALRRQTAEDLAAGRPWIHFSLNEEAEYVEVRLMVERGFRATLHTVNFRTTD